MGSRDSFLQAMKNLRDSGQPKNKDDDMQSVAVSNETTPEIIPEPDIMPAVQAEESGYQNMGQDNYSQYENAYAHPASGITVISKETSIVGEIHSSSNVDMAGTLKGNIETVGDIKLCGKIMGDIRGNNIDLIAGEVQGNIIAAATLTIDCDSVVVGDTTAANILMDGKQKGNMHVDSMADFQSNALLMGNVTTARLAISEGARLQGAIQVKMDNVDQGIFTQPIAVDNPENAE
ncbi:MAG: polymer-forming cytoskeletal protein [Clostridiales bacterium]|jgi:cytoskeletal protein CcmA (bactofilin family)|nr:polymer-forming cytoskeletal protein [Clostridiales bacterium]